MEEVFRVGQWLIKPLQNAVVSGEHEVHLQPKAMQVLTCLARNAPDVVLREELIERVWDGAFVSDEVITYNIRELRKALGDDAKRPRFIQTVPKRGYRLVASVSGSDSPLQGDKEATGEKSPYPGLEPFTDGDAKFFFGREEEVATLWRKLHRRHLLALIGPSGAGKSSLLRAGIIPAQPEGWRTVLCQPGSSPFVFLAQALVPEFSGDIDATRQLFRLQDPVVALSLLERWRTQHSEVLLLLDQFEELFTLNGEEVQLQFAELLGRAASELSIHVLLSLRDDFLIYCHDHSLLAPVFKDLTPLKPPTGDSLRRVLEQPALDCGYRFEDEDLVSEMLVEVTPERGALPLLAFAAARLWHKRDRKERLLTRDAYREIGGVAGSLARHAEMTLETIGSERQPVVREIFRNLATSQGTRAAQDRDELLSVFSDQDEAQQVLGALIGARLLTAYEIPEEIPVTPPAAGVPRAGNSAARNGRRVEIIHESLLTAWPRLVRWQTQETDGAQLRDQLRRAAQRWDSRGRPPDRLWTGASYLEFRAWRASYPGALTATEEAFAEAMTKQAQRRRKLRRRAAAAVFVLLLLVIGTIGAFCSMRSGKPGAPKPAISFLWDTSSWNTTTPRHLPTRSQALSSLTNPSPGGWRSKLYGGDPPRG